jgi:cystathionine beta-lyase
MDDEAMERFFVEKAKLGLNTGVSFGKEGSGFMRLNVGCPRATLEEAMRRLKGAMEEYV